MANYKDLQVDTHYIIVEEDRLRSPLVHMEIVYKGDNCCLVKTYYENNRENPHSYEWVAYSSLNFHAVVETLKGWNRDKLIDSILKD